MGNQGNPCSQIQTSLENTKINSQLSRLLTTTLLRTGTKDGEAEGDDAHARFGLRSHTRGFDPNRREEDATAEFRKRQDRLIQAARAGKYKMTVESVADGADIHCTTLRGQTPLMLCAGSHSKEALDTMKFLVEAMADVEAKDEAGWTPLLHSCRNNQNDIVNYLLECGASLKARSTDGKTAVMLAAMDSADQLVMSLLTKKAQIDKKDENGWSVLFFACQDGRHDLVKWLLKKQANTRDKAKDSTTPLMVAAENGSKKIGMKLFKKLANINARNVQGNTALMLSLRAQKEEFADWLVDAHADVTAKNADDEDALEIADMLGMHSIKNKLEMKARMANEEALGQTAH
jgi:ankyrin repeat protein